MTDDDESDREVELLALPDAEVHRLRLRNALTLHRTDAELTQRATAQQLDWSVSKVVRIEQGNVSIAPSDVRVMLSVYGVTDTARVDELVGLARTAREAQSWDAYDAVMTPAFRELVAQESFAAHIRKHEPTFVPGILQTKSFSMALLESLGFQGEAMSLRAEMRAKRQLLLRRESLPKMHFVIGEAALRRPVGSAEIMREQIDRLIELNQHSDINLFLMPFSAGPHPAMGIAFSILQFEVADLEDILFLEDGEQRSSSTDDPRKLTLYKSYYREIEKQAKEAGSFDIQASRIAKEVY